ncbi:unnamed protein product [Prunus armeniaca]
MQPTFLEMRLGKFPKRFRKWRREGLLRVLFAMSCHWFGYNLLSISAKIILDVPTVGGRFMLVDMAGSENIEQASQIGFEAKMQQVVRESLVQPWLYIYTSNVNVIK